MMKPEPGDVILYTAGGSSAWSSRLVAAGEILAGLGKGMKQYSHAAILSVDGYQFEATFPLTGHYQIDTKRPYEVWRIGNPTTAQRGKVLEWCRSHEHRLYNLIGVLTCGKLKLTDTYYCSEFACLAYRHAGLYPGDRIMSPDSIADYKHAKMIARHEPGRGHGAQ
jgi:hypothetical protein